MPHPVNFSPLSDKGSVSSCGIDFTNANF
jgi:hypothetical protein